MDRGVGQVTALVKQLGLDDDTIVFFTSDNGPAYDRLGGSDSVFFESANGFRGFKGSLYEGGIRVPLIARWNDKIAAGSKSDHVAAFWDVLPTVCELTGADAPEDIDGISFAPTLLGNARGQKQHDHLYWEFAAYGGQQAVRMGKWKGVRQNMLRQKNLTIELYDLQADPGETDDVAADHAEIVNQIETIMRTDRVPSELFKFKPLDDWQASANGK
jgi:arylsulfatase